jgi:type IX secretion system PorP/SprF family membrane protein
MKRLLIALGVLLCLGDAAEAQQLARRSQYLFNPYLLNPAVAGTTPYSPITASFRDQWTGFEGAPRTYMLSGHTRLPNVNLGLGAIAFHDNTGGAIARTGLEMTGAYSIDLNNRDAVSFGLSGVFSQFRFDAQDLVFRDADDPVLINAMETAFNFDVNFGMMVYGPNYFFGFSIPQLIQTKLGVVGALEDLNQNVRHYNFMGSYLYTFSDDFAIQPTALVRFTEVSPVQFDILNKLIYREFIWIGLSYRHLDAVALAVGFEYDDIAVAYSYDITTTDARRMSPHTHEVTLSYNIPRQSNRFRTVSSRKPSVKRRRAR